MPVDESLGAFAECLSGQGGQDTFEYLLTIGAVAVGLITALILGFEVLLPQVVGYICPSVDTASNIVSSVGSCISNLP